MCKVSSPMFIISYTNKTVPYNIEIVQHIHFIVECALIVILHLYILIVSKEPCKYLQQLFTSICDAGICSACINTAMGAYFYSNYTHPRITAPGKLEYLVLQNEKRAWVMEHISSNKNIHTCCAIAMGAGMH